MDWTCLLVDIDRAGFQDTWQAAAEGYEFGLALRYATADEALPMLETGSVAMMVLFASSPSKTVIELLEAFRHKVGAIATFQAIVCDDPVPRYMADVFEYGIEQFLPLESWAQEVAMIAREAATTLSDKASSENRAIQISRSIQSGDQPAIMRLEAELGDSYRYDFLAAYAKGHACQATGRFEEAVEAFRASRKMNQHFRPASTGLGENLLVTGRVDEAIEIFEQMERSNPRSVHRKANLAAAWMEKGDFKKAAAYIKEAQTLEPGHPRVAEAKAQILLASGKVGEAFKMMDSLSEVGPYFAAKLNEMGIRLSQAGKGKSALALYGKAHRVVRPELRYKISLNAALACHRLQDFRLALKYLVRCEKEYGQSFDKLEKIRSAVKAALLKQQKQQSVA